MAGGSFGDILVGDEVSAGASRGAVLGGGDEEFPRASSDGTPNAA